MHLVIKNQHTYGFYLWGPRGVGKSTGIELALKKNKTIAVKFAGTMTPQAMFLRAKENRDSVLWINDDPNLLKSTETQQYLLAMLEGERIVTRARVKATDNERFIFRGKIIFDSNVNINKGKATLAAVQDRMAVYRFDPSSLELAAVLRQTAISPTDKRFPYIRIRDEDRIYWKGTTEKERITIAEYIIALSSEHQMPISLRMLRDGLKFLEMKKKFDYKTDWKDYILQQMTDMSVTPTTSKKEERLNTERQSLIEMLEDYEELKLGAIKKGREFETLKDDVIKTWCNITGLKPMQFRRRLAECPEHIQEFYNSLKDKRSVKE